MFHVRNDQQDMLVVSLMANVNLTLSLFVIFLQLMTTLTLTLSLRALVCKNQTYSGKGGKFDFFLILMLNRLGYS